MNAFSLIIFYPIISVIINRLAGEQGSLWAQLREEYYLFLGIVFVFGVILMLVLMNSKPFYATWLVFVIFTIIYFSISVIRKLVFTESKDIFSPSHT